MAPRKEKDSSRTAEKSKESPEAVLKALSSLDSTEEKLAALCKKYADLLEENRLMQQRFKQSQKSLAVIIKEKDQLQSEHSKAILAKSKLESLCRELQRHNKLIKEESLARAKEEEEKRKEVTTRFQTTINDIQSQMNEHYQKNTKLSEENIDLANKLKKLIEQYEVREEYVQKALKHRDLEQQLSDAKLAQATLQLSEQQESSQHEKTSLLAQVQQYQAKVALQEEQEKQLRAQVSMYTEKYEEFQQTLTKSNDVFQTFKSEMDKMTKKIKKLEKETTMWRSRWENSNRTLLEMAEEKTRSDKEILSLNTKISKLESLCRALQDERRKYNTQNGGVTQDSENNVQAVTKTPPNTPEQSSRASPVTVQSEPMTQLSTNQKLDNTSTNENADSHTADENVADTIQDGNQSQDYPINGSPEQDETANHKEEQDDTSSNQREQQVDTTTNQEEEEDTIESVN